MIVLLRTVFILVSAFSVFIYFLEISIKTAIIFGIFSAVISLLLIIGIEYVSHTFSSKRLFAIIIGLLAGLILSHMIVLALPTIPFTLSPISLRIISAIIYYIISFSVMLFFVINYEDIAILDKIIPGKIEEGTDSEISYKILDTSVIIDGRISDICETGFLEGILVIPNFVLHELQMIADSADPIKRNRGRRGLDILNKMEKDNIIMLKISDVDFPEIDEVDSKLVKLASVMNAKVITNDFNLNKVAEFHGVSVLNINKLASALKPVVLTGEEMLVHLVKEGKDSNQAIGYLEDGTMIVVENGRRKLNEKATVVITSVLQTTAGRMLFSKLKDENK
ncbi:MAG: hypothetical protein SVR08_06655 [Spirochaetota bacterium]|nr:hypothetical protein [Spirochaetota bacterium]